MRKLTFVISLILVLQLIYATSIELYGYHLSKNGFAFFPLLAGYHQPVFWILMFAQIVLAGLLLICRTRLIGSYGVFLLLAFLSTYLYCLQHYADHVPCACTGIIPNLSWNGHMWFTIAFTLLAGANVVLLPKEIHTRE